MKTRLFLGCLFISTFFYAQTNDSIALSEHFTRPISHYDPFKYPPVKTYDQLYERINMMLINIESFSSAYHDIKIISSKKENNTVQIKYRYQDKIDSVYAYFKPARDSLKINVGINVIPGSGVNQSNQMYRLNNIGRNYQSNIDDIAQKYGDVYILIKPNEDILAIHNGFRKLGYESYVNHLINNGSSYSVYYLVQSLVLSKFISLNYTRTVVAGLSQGGLATLINALQSKPDKAIVASGFSVLMETPYRSGHNQIIIPGWKKLYNHKEIRELILESNTQYLFTYGEEEIGIYERESIEGITKSFFAETPNVFVKTHTGGHLYDEN